MHQDIDRVLFSQERIAERVQALGAELNEALRETPDAIVMPLLKGSVLFAADLLRAIEHPVRVEFARASSYGAGTESSGQVKLDVADGHELAGQTVVVVDDILDTGRTLAAIAQHLTEDLGVRAVRSAVLLNKGARRALPVEADHVGFEVEDVFVVGYGLDFAGRYRNLPYVGVLHERCYR